VEQFMSRKLLAAASGFLAVTVMVGVAYSQIAVPAQQQPPFPGGRDTAAGIHIEPVRGNIYMLAGSGGNITLQVGPEGALIVDTGVAEKTDALLSAIQETSMFHLRSLSGPATPIRYIINTSINPEHIGGNWKIATSKYFDPVQGGEQIIGHGNVLNRLTTESEDKAEQPGTITDAYFTEYYKLNRFFNGEGVQVIHVPSGNTDGDSIVWFRGSDVISTGDLLETHRYPTIDIERGGSVNGVIAGLNALLDLTYPEFRGQGGTILIPGHGRLSFANDAAYYRDMITIVRDRVKYMIDKKNTLQQIKAAGLTKDYDPIYGTEAGSTDRFIEAIYRSLTQKQ
jgi:cyclase